LKKKGEKIMKEQADFERAVISGIAALFFAAAGLVLNWAFNSKTYEVFGWTMISGLIVLQLILWMIDSRAYIISRMRSLVNRGTVLAIIVGVLFPVGSLGVTHFAFGCKLLVCLFWVMIIGMLSMAAILLCLRKWKVPRAYH
jgi:hypothetical protein